MDALWLRFIEEQKNSRVIQDLFKAWARTLKPSDLSQLDDSLSANDADKRVIVKTSPTVNNVVPPSPLSPKPIVSSGIVPKTIAPLSPTCAPARDASAAAFPRSRSASPCPVDAEMADPLSDSGDALTASDSSSSTDGFIEVVGKGKKRARRNKSQQVPAKSAKTDDHQADASPSILTPTLSPAASQAYKGTPGPSSQPSATPKTPVPPPIFLHEKGKWAEVSDLCTKHHINFTNACSVKDGIKITVPTATDFRSLTRLLKDSIVPFHTYTLPENRLLRVVIKSVPVELSCEDILSDLKAQGIPAVNVHRMYRARGKAPYEMVLAAVEKSATGKAIFNIKSICRLSGIKVEVPHKRGANISQCHRCQKYGHSQLNCFGHARCVKCLGEHGTADCPRPKDRTQCAEPPSCVLCGEKGHPANYRGCPKAPKPAVKRPAARAPVPAQKPVSEQIPLSPQRPTGDCWNMNTHRRAFPALVSLPKRTPMMPELMDNPIPCAAFKPASQSAQESAEALPAPTPSPAIAAVKNYIKLYKSFDLKRVELMHRAIEKYPFPVHAQFIKEQFSDVFDAYEASLL